MRQNIIAIVQRAPFEFIMNEAFKNNIHVETAFDIVENLMANGKNKQKYLCYM
jgi:hypothetical protein